VVCLTLAEDCCHDDVLLDMLIAWPSSGALTATAARQEASCRAVMVEAVTATAAMPDTMYFNYFACVGSEAILRRSFGTHYVID
jgi:hypothetical protein